MQHQIIDGRNLLVIFVVLLIAGIIGFWLPYQLSRNKPLPINSSGHAKVIVEYKQDGFDPKIITVPIGTTVGWINPSGRPMWVASDPHPSHTDLPGFDQLQIINKTFPEEVEAHGPGIYEYTFIKLGTWGYHNHLYPQHRGTVIVVESK